MRDAHLQPPFPHSIHRLTAISDGVFPVTMPLRLANVVAIGEAWCSGERPAVARTQQQGFRRHDD